MKPRDINQGYIWGTIHDACESWGVPGLSGVVKIYLSRTMRWPSIATARPFALQIRLRETYWRRAHSDECGSMRFTHVVRSKGKYVLCKEQTRILIHEMAHIATFLKYGKFGHGPEFKKLMRKIVGKLDATDCGR